MAKKTWAGTPPTRCEICMSDLNLRGTFVDGKTAFGPWAMMCTGCHHDNGGKLGVGFGQKYNFIKETGEWVKDEGK